MSFSYLFQQTDLFSEVGRIFDANSETVDCAPLGNTKKVMGVHKYPTLKPRLMLHCLSNEQNIYALYQTSALIRLFSLSSMSLAKTLTLSKNSCCDPVFLMDKTFFRISKSR